MALTAAVDLPRGTRCSCRLGRRARRGGRAGPAWRRGGDHGRAADLADGRPVARRAGRAGGPDGRRPACRARPTTRDRRRPRRPPADRGAPWPDDRARRDAWPRLVRRLVRATRRSPRRCAGSTRAPGPGGSTRPARGWSRRGAGAARRRGALDRLRHVAARRRDACGSPAAPWSAPRGAGGGGDRAPAPRWPGWTSTPSAGGWSRAARRRWPRWQPGLAGHAGDQVTGGPAVATVLGGDERWLLLDATGVVFRTRRAAQPAGLPLVGWPTPGPATRGPLPRWPVLASLPAELRDRVVRHRGAGARPDHAEAERRPQRSSGATRPRTRRRRGSPLTLLDSAGHSDRCQCARTWCTTVPIGYQTGLVAILLIDRRHAGRVSLDMTLRRITLPKRPIVDITLSL